MLEKVSQGAFVVFSAKPLKNTPAICIEMKKTVALFSVILFAAMLCGAGELQRLPKSKTLKVKAGDYTVTFHLTRMGRLSGFAYQGKQLFISDTASAGTDYEPFPQEKLTSLKITVDGKVPPQLDSVMTGKNIVVERNAVYGSIDLISRFEISSSGMVWKNRYRINSADGKPRYFWLFTMPWDTGFTRFLSSHKGKVKSGKLTNSGKWLLCSETDILGLYNSSIQMAVVIRPLTLIPTDSRRHHSLWDHRVYHKYFVLHKNPEWKKEFVSPEYAMAFSAAAMPEEKFAGFILDFNNKPNK